MEYEEVIAAVETVRELRGWLMEGVKSMEIGGEHGESTRTWTVGDNDATVVVAVESHETLGEGTENTGCELADV